MELATEAPFEPLPGTSEEFSKLGKCEVCTIQTAKYTCPRCEIKTCCLRCSTIHKREFECDGTRDRTKFIRLEKFSNLDMSSDYHLLEEIGRSISIYKKGLKKSHPRDKILPSRLFRLQKSALLQNIRLKYLPSHFKRHKTNSSRLQYNENLIYWTIELVFVHADYLRLVESHVVETTDLKDIIEKRLNDPEYSEKLERYLKDGLNGARYFLKAEEIAGNKFYEMDINKSMSANLRGKVIIEYPIVHVVLYDFSTSVDVIKQALDLEAESVITMESDVNNDINDPEEIYTCMKNLLFIDDDI